MGAAQATNKTQEEFFYKIFDLVECQTKRQDAAAADKTQDEIQAICDPVAQQLEMMDKMSETFSDECKELYDAKKKELPPEQFVQWNGPCRCTKEAQDVLTKDGFVASCFVAMGTSMRENPDYVIWKPEKQPEEPICFLFAKQFADSKCQDCVGSWGEWSACTPSSPGAEKGSQTRTFTITTYADGGEACPSDLMETQSCDVIPPPNPR